MSEIRGPGNNVEGPAVPGGPGATPSLPPSASVQQLTQRKMQRLSFRVEAARAKRHLEDAEWDAAIRIYSRLLVLAGHEQDPAINAEEDIAALTNAVAANRVLSDLPAKAVVQMLLGRSAAWFGCEEYWRSYEDASSALAVDAHKTNRWALLRVGHCLQRMHFYSAAIDVFRQGQSYDARLRCTCTCWYNTTKTR